VSTLGAAMRGALTSPTINISGSTAINLTGPTNCINDATFQQAVRTNLIQSQANTPLIIAALIRKFDI
jgi:hypothetical protein